MPSLPYVTFNNGITNSFTSLTGLSVIPSGFSVVYIDNFFKSWSQQIDTFTGVTFEVTPQVSKVYKIDNCNASYLAIGCWQSSPELIIEQINKGIVTKVLTLGVDFDYEFSKDRLCITGLDFSCYYPCYCQCEKIRITGSYGYSATPPFDVVNLLVESMKKVLTTNSGYGLTSQVYSYKTDEKSRNMTSKVEVNQSYVDIANKLISGTPITDLLEASCLNKYNIKPLFKSISLQYEEPTPQFYTIRDRYPSVQSSQEPETIPTV